MNINQSTENPIVWQTVRNNLFQFVRKRVPTAVIAEDITQDVLLKMLTRLDTLQEHEKLTAWMYQITRNSIVDYYRQRQETAELPLDLPEWDYDTDNTVTAEAAQCVLPFMQQLPEHYREAIKLAEMDGLTQQAVAQQLDISLSGAKSRVQRGRQLLKSLLLQCCRFEFDQRGSLVEFGRDSSCEAPACDTCG
jgi:RNA polymerase sigma-70 factor (ECF subfamily)